MPNPSITPAGLSIINFDLMEGPALGPLLNPPEIFTRRNIDGQGYQRFGKRAPIVQLVTQEAVSNAGYNFANVTSKLETYAAAVGKLATVVQQSGESFASVMILNVEQAPRTFQPFIRLVGFSANGLADPRIIVTAIWTVQRTE